MAIPKPIITKEHGSWAVLFVPMIVGAVYMNTFSWNVVLLAFSSLGVFLSYVPVHTLLREYIGVRQGKEKIAAAKFWAVAYLGAGILFVLPLLAQGLWNLLFISILGALSFFGNFFLTRKIQKSIPSDLVAVIGLTLSAPSAYYVSTKLLDVHALVLWLLNVLFFGCSVFYVHLKIQASKLRKEPGSLYENFFTAKLSVLYHFVVIALVRILVLNGLAPVMTVFAFLPMFFHAIIGTVRLGRRVKFKNLGFMLLGHSVLYGVILVLLMQ